MRFSFEDLSNKDFRTSLGLWVLLELICFGALPMLRIISSYDLYRWFLLSLPLGVGGAFLIAVSSDFVLRSQDDEFEGSRLIFSWVGQVGSWFGIVGVTFPLMVAISRFLEEFAKVKA